MTTIASASKATSASVREGLVGRKRDVSGTVFLVLLLGSLLFSLAILFILLADVMSKGLPVFAERGTDFLTSPLSSNPAKAGVAQGIIGTAILGVIVAVTAFPFGLATATYLEEYAGEGRLTRFIQINIRNLAGVPSVVYGLLGLSVFVALFAVAGDRHRPQHPRRRRDARGARPPDRDHHLDRGPAGRPQRDPRGRLRRRRVALGGHPPARPAGGRPGRAHRHGARAVAGARRDGAAHPRRRGARARSPRRWTRSCTGPYTAMPVIVYDWSRKPQEAFRADAAAAIIVLLAITLFANAVAIYLRNRYERTW